MHYVTYTVLSCDPKDCMYVYTIIDTYTVALLANKNIKKSLKEPQMD